MNMKRIIVRNKSQRGTRYTSIIVQTITYTIFQIHCLLCAALENGKVLPKP